MTETVAGIDGARGGWVIAELGEGIPSVRFGRSIAPELDALRSSRLAAAVVDMPIGLSANGDRPADHAARALLGPRRATFFPTPVRAILDHDRWEDANRASREVSGKGLSKQTWNLVPKIREIDDLWTPDLRETLSEGHPELSFAQMAGEPVMSKKSTPEGQHERTLLLIEHVGSNVEAIIAECPRSWRADAVDALAVAWTARRIACGQATILGGGLDPAGRPMQLAI